MCLFRSQVCPLFYCPSLGNLGSEIDTLGSDLKLLSLIIKSKKLQILSVDTHLILLLESLQALMRLNECSLDDLYSCHRGVFGVLHYTSSQTKKV